MMEFRHSEKYHNECSDNQKKQTAVEYQLPKDLLCTQCILQWRYVAGNNWGMCKNGTGMLGCGPQEEFRACADIAILGDGEVTTFEDYPEQDIVPHSPDDADNEIDSDLHKKGEETEEDEEFRVGERVAAILCAFMLTSLVLLLALWLSYVGKKRIVAFCGGLAPPKVTYFTKFLKPQKGTSKPGIPSTDPYGTPSAAIHAALERGEKPPVAPSRSVKPPAIYHNGFTNATLTAPGSSAGGEPKRPSVAPPPPPSRPPRQRSPKRQTSLGADDERTTDAESSITVNGVALPD
ncbi:unnamed protein product [Notodromas monacha]|uniref:Chitin-binding type-4 domain-containing protein n=1 Tax=Notodromas monacha TaxID=399045 RepID=A0A7R9BX82_9CRUS|nr:unnamed protein product [Notodromas monacha]CAG0922478.1 unnamed protein product [Notodromas monacha]